MELKNLFNSWAKSVEHKYVDKQWLLSKWEVLEGIEWPQEKIDIMINTIVEGIDLKSSDRLADLGCGGGWILKLLKDRVDAIVGLDFSQEMLANAKQYCPQETFVCGDIAQLPFKGGAFDCVISYFVFLNFMDDDFIFRAIKDIMGTVKTGGRVLIGQLPDKNCSSDYDQAKNEYFEYCEHEFKIGKSNRDVYRAPQKLFNKDVLIDFFKKEQISYQFRNSFNPFYRTGQAETVHWRFDLILEKK